MYAVVVPALSTIWTLRAQPARITAVTPNMTPYVFRHARPPGEPGFA